MPREGLVRQATYSTQPRVSPTLSVWLVVKAEIRRFFADRRAGARSITRRSGPLVTSAPARVRRIGLPSDPPLRAACKCLQFGEFHRAFIADMGDGAAEQPQSDLGRQAREPSGRNSTRLPSPQGDSEKISAACVTVAWNAASARRTRRASSSEPRPGQAFLRQCRHQLTQPGTRETRIAVGGIVGIRQARFSQSGDQPRLGDVEQRPQRPRHRTSASRAPCRQVRTGRCRAPDGSARSRPDRRAYARSARAARLRCAASAASNA